MAKGGNKNATKSFVMLIVTGVVLVAVTLCWFAITNSTNVESISSSVDNTASSKATLWVAEDAEGNIADRAGFINEYVLAETEGETIVLENMVPGAEYFYKAEFKDCLGDFDVKMELSNIVDKGLQNMITVHSRFTTSADTTIHSDSQNPKPLSDGTLISDKISCTEKTTYIIYFSFKFSEDATIGADGTSSDYRNKSVAIGNWDAVISSPETESTTSSETV